MRFLVLGSAAGGGFPQWNCLCPNCRLAWERDPRAERRSQASLAVSRDGEDWILLGASPDLRQQILDAPALHPRHAPRHTPIRGVFLPNGDIDNIAGLLVMREMQPFTIWGSEATLAHVSGGVFAAVDAKLCPRVRVALGRDARHRPRLHAHARSPSPARSRSTWSQDETSWRSASKARRRSAWRSRATGGAPITSRVARA